MPARPIQISIDESLLAEVDADTETQRSGRSAFVRSAVERYLADKRRRHIDAQILAAYGGRAEITPGDATMMDAQQWPDD